MKAMCVTGFVPNAFPARHLSLEQCRKYGRRLKDACGDSMVAYDNWRIEDCWAHGLLRDNPSMLPSCANPPEDRFEKPVDMTLSNIVLLQRYEWMQMAAAECDADVFAWIEYTCLKQRNVTELVLRTFVERLQSTPCDAVTLPGCWQRGLIDDSKAHWRFVGSCWVCPRHLVTPAADAVKTIASLRARLTGRLSWDMNTFAYVELLDCLPIRWYEAGHDETQFLRYGT